VNTVVEIITAWVEPGLSAGVMLNDIGVADSPCTAGTETEHVTEAAVPLVRTVTTFGVVLEPAATVVLVGLHATV
jgi:hypothetical protein